MSSLVHQDLDLKSYPVMKDSCVPWLGKVPEHWEVRKLRTVLKPLTERNRPDLPLLSVVREKGVIQRDMTIDDANHNFIPDDLSNYKVVRTGQFAMNKMKAWQGSYGVSLYDGIVSPAYFVFDLRNVGKEFFHTAIRSKMYVPFFTQSSDGVRIGQWDLAQSRMKEIPFFVPSLSEQAAIVRYLDFMDRRIRRYIRAKQKLIKLLEEQKQTIIHHAVTRGLDPNVRLKHSGVEWLGDIPERWEVRKIGSLGIFYKGRGIARADITDTGVPAITYGDIYTKYGIEIKSLGKYTSDAVAANAQKISKGDLLFTASGETIEEIGKTTLYSGDLIGYAGGDIIILQLHNGDGLYLSYALNCGVGIRQKSAFGRGDIIVHISASKLKQVVIPFPPLEEQDAIAKHLDRSVSNVATAISHAHREIELLREYRTRLIADVVTGKLDVREAAARLPDKTEEPELIDEPDELKGAEEDAADDLDTKPEEEIA